MTPTSPAGSSALRRLAPVLLALAVQPALALDVVLKFQLPNNMGNIDAGFTGFDVNRDGVISSIDGEVSSVWSSLTGRWDVVQLQPGAGSSFGKVDVQYKYPEAESVRSSFYGNDGYFGLTRFGVDIKLESGNHVRSNSLMFRLDGRQPSLAASGISWSDVYNAPSSYAYSFVGPENAVGLVLRASGDVFAASIPEAPAWALMAVGLTGCLVRGSLAARSRRAAPPLV